MASSFQKIIVDSKPKLVSLLDKLGAVRPPNHAFNPPSLFCDIEGPNLGHHGTMSILSLFLYPDNTVYLIDVQTLQQDVFTTTNEDGTTLKTVLESSTIPKGFFDIRNDSHALFSLFGIKVACVHDIQLMELASRMGSKERVSDLTRCIELDLKSVSDRADVQRVLSAKRAGEIIWNPDFGGTCSSLNERPMLPAIIEYCSAGISILPSLWRHYIGYLGGGGQMFWRSQVWKTTLVRITESQATWYDPDGGDKSAGPCHWMPGVVDRLERESFAEFAGDYIHGFDDCPYIEDAFGQTENI